MAHSFHPCSVHKHCPCSLAPPSPPLLLVPSSRQLLLCVTSHPPLLSKHFSPLSQAMAVSIALFLAVLAILPRLKHHHLIRVAMAQQMQQRKGSLHQETRWVLQDTEQSRPVEEATLLSVWQQWSFWTRKMKLASHSCCDQDSSSSRKEENTKDEENFNRPHSGVRSLVVPTLLPIQVLPDTARI